MQDQTVSQPTGSAQTAVRLHYLDWLRVIAILMVFLIHLVHVFDTLTWHVKNAVQSEALTFFVGFLYPWGMPFFFLISGAGSWFALQRRTARQFARERILRLLLPFIAGSLLLMPVMLYFEWRQKVQTGVLASSFAEYAARSSDSARPALLLVGRQPPLVHRLPVRVLAVHAAGLALAEGRGRSTVHRVAGAAVRAPRGDPVLYPAAGRSATRLPPVLPRRAGLGGFLPLHDLLRDRVHPVRRRAVCPGHPPRWVAGPSVGRRRLSRVGSHVRDRACGEPGAPRQPCPSSTSSGFSPRWMPGFGRCSC